MESDERAAAAPVVWLVTARLAASACPRRTPAGRPRRRRCRR